MSILSFGQDHLCQRCAACQLVREVPVADLVRGLATAPIEGGILGLPPCPCGAGEFLIHSPEDEPPHPMPGSLGHLHRLAVDALVDVLTQHQSNNKQLKHLAESITTMLGTETVSTWFPHGLELGPREPACEESPLIHPEEST